MKNGLICVQIDSRILLTSYFLYLLIQHYGIEKKVGERKITNNSRKQAQ